MKPNNSLPAIVRDWIAYWPVLVVFPILAMGGQALLNSLAPPVYSASAQVQASDTGVSNDFLARLVPDVRSQVLNEWTLSFSAEDTSPDRAKERVEKALATAYAAPFVLGAERVARIMQHERIEAAIKLLENTPGTEDAREVLRVDAAAFSERLNIRVSSRPTAAITVSATYSKVTNLMGAGLSAIFIALLVVSILRYRAKWSLPSGHSG